MGIFKSFFGKGSNQKPDNDKTQIDIIADTQKIYPFIARVDLKNHENGALIFNPGGNEKLLKKISDDLGCLFLLVKDKHSPEFITKDLIEKLDLTSEQIVAYAEQNTLRHFNEKCQILQKKIDNTSSLFKMVLDNRTEANTMISSEIWNTIKEELGDYIFVSVPKQNEINYCSIEGNSLQYLLAITHQTFKDAGDQKLSPNIYLLHESKWVMFDKGMGQIFEYCSQNNLIDGLI